ncbi:hypothetical protein BT69DRAFT_1346826 [Atractiella rhizophila]|nr:hypothetical protein BT69DRAFT_1346826 [Atractiella rhizophila]
MAPARSSSPDDALKDSPPGPLPSYPLTWGAGTKHGTPECQIITEDLPSSPGRWDVILLFMPSILGLAFCIFCFGVRYSNAVVVSHSTSHIAEIRGAFNALWNTWIFVSLLFADNIIDAIRSQEWFRRLRGGGKEGTPFAAIDHVSSGLGGLLRHAVALLGYRRSSTSFKIGFLAALIGLGLNDLAPSILQIVPGWTSAHMNTVMIPSLPANSLNSDFSKPFNISVNTRASAVALYYVAHLHNISIPSYSFVPSNAVLPQPNSTRATEAESYDSDIATIDYRCEWTKPTFISLPDRNKTGMESFANVTYGANGFYGLGAAPIESQSVMQLASIYTLDDNKTLIPSFDGILIFVALTTPSSNKYLDNLYLNLSSVPTVPIPDEWSNAFGVSGSDDDDSPLGQAYLFPTAFSMIVCIPTISISSFSVSITGNEPSFNLSDPLGTRVGNIDEQQLKFALVDAVYGLGLSAPIINELPFTVAGSSPRIGTPLSNADLSSRVTSVQQAVMGGYFVDSPLGNLEVPSKRQSLGLVFAVHDGFLWAVTVLYLALALISTFVLRIGKKERRLKSLGINTVLALFEGSNKATTNGCLSGRELKDVVATQVPFGSEKLVAGEEMVEKKLRTANLYFTESETVEVEVGLQSPLRNLKREEVKRQAVSYAGLLTPILGTAFCAFAGYAHNQTLILNIGTDTGKFVLASTLFTLFVGIIRTLALGGVRSVIREVRSEEWSRICSRVSDPLDPSVQHTLENASTNITSFFKLLQLTWLHRPYEHISGYFRIAFISFLIVSIASIISQGVIQLQLTHVALNQPYQTSIVSLPQDSLWIDSDSPGIDEGDGLDGFNWPDGQDLDGILDGLGLGGHVNPGSEPSMHRLLLRRDALDSLDPTLNGLKDLLFSASILNSFAYLEQVKSVTVGLRYPYRDAAEGYFLLQPQDTLVGNTLGRDASVKFRTDIGRWTSRCEIVEAQIESYTDWSNRNSNNSVLGTSISTIEPNIRIPSKGLNGTTEAPCGAGFIKLVDTGTITRGGVGGAPLGAFVWAVGGGDEENLIDLSRVQSSSIQDDWQQFCESNPDYLASSSRLVGLYCEPTIEILYGSYATIYNGSVTFDLRNDTTNPVGNLVSSQLAYLLSIVGLNLPYPTITARYSPKDIWTDSLAGHISLGRSPSGNSSVLRPMSDIEKSLNQFSTSLLKSYQPYFKTSTNTSAYPVVERYAVQTSYPQFIITAILFSLLSLAIFIFQCRTRMRKFTVSGILAAGATDLRGWTSEKRHELD